MTDNIGLARYSVSLSPFEIGIILHWPNTLTVNMEEDSTLRKLKGAIDQPIGAWISDWQQSMDEAEALKRLHAALNPVVLDFTAPELRTMLLWSQADQSTQIGTGGDFRLGEEQFLIEKLERLIDRAEAEAQARRDSR